MESVRARRDDERGQVTTALFCVVTTGLVAVGIFGVAQLSRGVDERTQAQSAADAAALAGADSIRDSLPVLLGVVGSKNGLQDALGGCGRGYDAAAQYAARNDAALTSYCFDASTGRVEAVVRMNDPVTAEVGPAEAGAVASVGFDLASCGWDDDEPPEPTPTPTPTPTQTPGPGDPSPTTEPTPPPPPPPPDSGTTLTCGPLVVDFTVDGVTGLLGDPVIEVDLDDLEPSLVD